MDGSKVHTNLVYKVMTVATGMASQVPRPPAFSAMFMWFMRLAKQPHPLRIQVSPARTSSNCRRFNRGNSTEAEVVQFEAL